MEGIVTLQKRHEALARMVEILTKCRDKKDLSPLEMNALVDKYEPFLLPANNLLSLEQKQRNILKILRSNVSTLTGALEELLPTEKALYEAVRSVEESGGVVQSLPVEVPAPVSPATQPTQRSLRPSLHLGFLSSHSFNTPNTRNSFRITTQSPLTTPTSAVSHTVTSQSLRESLTQHLLTVFSLREAQFYSNMTGRSHADRTHSLRSHIAAITSLFDNFSPFLPLDNPEQGFKKKINLRAVYLEGLDFSELNLTYCDFGNNSIRDCRFFHCQPTLSLTQLAFVTQFDSVSFPSEQFRGEFVEFKIQQMRDSLREIEKMIEECKFSLDCLLNFFLFACSRPFDVRVACKALSVDDLRRTAFSLLNDEDINRIGIVESECDVHNNAYNSGNIVNNNNNSGGVCERERELLLCGRGEWEREEWKFVLNIQKEIELEIERERQREREKEKESESESVCETMSSLTHTTDPLTTHTMPTQSPTTENTSDESSGNDRNQEEVDSERESMRERESESGTTRWSYLWVNEHRTHVFSLSRNALYLALHHMLLARHFSLPEEVLSLSIDRKTYNFEEEISSSKLFLKEIEKTVQSLKKLCESDPWTDEDYDREREDIHRMGSFATRRDRESFSSLSRLSLSHNMLTQSLADRESLSRLTDSDKLLTHTRSHTPTQSLTHTHNTHTTTLNTPTQRERELSSLYTLTQTIQRLVSLQAVVLSERSQRRVENNIFRRSVYLAMLNAPCDVALRQGPTERLAEVMKLSRVTDFLPQQARSTRGDPSEDEDDYTHHHTDNLLSANPYTVPYCVDLTHTDLSHIDFSQIDFTHTFSLVTQEQESRYLTPHNVQQRYSLLYEYARSGDADALNRVIQDCALDVDVCDPRGTSALMHACIARRPTTAYALLTRHRASVTIRTPTGWDVMSTLCAAIRDPLSGATDRVSQEIVDMLVRERSVEISVHNAARLGMLTLLKKFSLKELQSLCPATEYSVAHIAARDNAVEILKFLQERKFDFEHAHHGEIAKIAPVKEFRPVTSKSFFSLGSGGGNNSVEETPRNGSISTTSSVGRNGSIHTTTNSSVADNVERERERVAAIARERDRERPSALWVACEHGRTDAAIVLVQYCPNLRDVVFRGMSPVKIALRLGFLSLARALCERECAIDAEVAVTLRDVRWIDAFLNSPIGGVSLARFLSLSLSESEREGEENGSGTLTESVVSQHSQPTTQPAHTTAGSRFSSLLFLSPLRHTQPQTPSTTQPALTTPTPNTPLPQTQQPQQPGILTANPVSSSVKAYSNNTTVHTAAYRQGVQSVLLYACKTRWKEAVQWLLVTHSETLSLSERGERERERCVDVVCAQGDESLMALLLQYCEERKESQPQDDSLTQTDNHSSYSTPPRPSQRHPSHNALTQPPHTIPPTLTFSVNASHTHCAPLVFTAIARRRWAVLRLLLTDTCVDLSVRHHGRTPLHALLLARAASDVPPVAPVKVVSSTSHSERENKREGESERDTDTHTSVSHTAEETHTQEDPLALPHTLRCDLVELMLAQGASVLERDSDGQTALHYAARVSDEVASRVLHAYVCVKNKSGFTALDFAAKAGMEMATLRF